MSSYAPPRRHALLAVAVAFALTGTVALPAAAADAPQAARAETKAQKLDRLYEAYWEETLKLNPLQATFQGDSRYNDQLPNFLTAEFRQQAHDFTVRWLKTIEDVGPEGLSGQDRLSYDIFVKNAKDSLEGEQFPGHLMPMNQFTNLAGFAAQLGSGTGPQPFKTVKDYDNWRARGAKMPAIFDQAIANMREGMRLSLIHI